MESVKCEVLGIPPSANITSALCLEWMLLRFRKLSFPEQGVGGPLLLDLGGNQVAVMGDREPRQIGNKELNWRQ